MGNIILVGFMGTGKTTVGKALAKRLGYRFVDMRHNRRARGDENIEIFEKKGEQYFRRVEERGRRRYSVAIGPCGCRG
jgi:shikimate kinase